MSFNFPTTDLLRHANNTFVSASPLLLIIGGIFIGTFLIARLIGVFRGERG